MTKELTRAELEVMQILWRLEAAFVGEIIDAMEGPKPAYNTVSTIVRILEQKGFVAHDAFGRSHRYHPLINKERYTHNYMRGVVQNFFDNSPAQMLSFFAAREELSVAELDELRAMAESLITGKNDAL